MGTPASTSTCTLGLSHVLVHCGCQGRRVASSYSTQSSLVLESSPNLFNSISPGPSLSLATPATSSSLTRPRQLFDSCVWPVHRFSSVMVHPPNSPVLMTHFSPHLNQSANMPSALLANMLSADTSSAHPLSSSMDSHMFFSIFTYPLLLDMPIHLLFMSQSLTLDLNLSYVSPPLGF